MKIKYKKICIIILMCIIITIGAVAFLNKEETFENVSSLENQYEHQEINEIIKENSELSTEEEKQKIDEIKTSFGITGDTDLYEVQKGYNNTEIAVVKPSIKYKVAFAGMIQNEKPTISELDSIIQNNHPKYTGIWIENNSREKFLKLLKNQTKAEYKIDDLRLSKS